MREVDDVKQRVAIIGGGITGLAAAERIRQAADEGCDVQFALYEKDDLKSVGRKRIARWNAREHQVMMRYTRGESFSLKHPWHPCLDSESLLARVGWLAYMARWEPDGRPPQRGDG